MNPTAKELVTLLAPSFSVFTYDRRGRGGKCKVLAYTDADVLEPVCVRIPVPVARWIRTG